MAASGFLFVEADLVCSFCLRLVMAKIPHFCCKESSLPVASGD